MGRAADPVVRFIAQGDALRRAATAAAVADVRSEQARFRELEPLLRNLAERVRQAEEMCLLSLGYQRGNGKWQPVKCKHTRRRPKSDPDDGDKGPTRELFRHLAWQAGRGDREAGERLRHILQANPDIWRSIGDLRKHAEQSLIDLVARGNPVLAESVRLKTEEMRKALLAEADGTLERLLIDELVVCWLEQQYVRVAAIQPQQFKGDARFWQERHERANKRYLTIIRELATFRELVGNAGGVVPGPDVTKARNRRCGRPREAKVD